MGTQIYMWWVVDIRSMGCYSWSLHDRSKSTVSFYTHNTLTLFDASHILNGQPSQYIVGFIFSLQIQIEIGSIETYRSLTISTGGFREGY